MIDNPIRKDTRANIALGDGYHAPAQLTANGDLRVRDDDLLSTLAGASAPNVASYHSVALNLSANTANQQIVAAPGENKQIWVYAIAGHADTGAGTVAFQDEDDNALTGAIAVSDERGFVLPHSGSFAMPWFKVATNKALEADTVTCSFTGVLCYAIVNVSS